MPHGIAQSAWLGPCAHGGLADIGPADAVRSPLARREVAGEVYAIASAEHTVPPFDKVAMCIQGPWILSRKGADSIEELRP